MHWQRILVMAAALCIAPTVILPWLHSALPEGNIVGYQSQWIIASCAFALITAVAAMLGNRELRLTVIGWLSAFGTGVFAFAVSLVLYIVFLGTNVLTDGAVWPGFGLFLTLFSSVFLLGTAMISPIVLLIMKKPTASQVNKPELAPLAASVAPSEAIAAVESEVIEMEDAEFPDAKRTDFETADDTEKKSEE